MIRCKPLAACLALAGVLTLGGTPAHALESGPAVVVAVEAAPPPAEAAAPMDPALRALLVGLAASMLREAAASPDPMAGLGSAVERTFTGLLQSPETLQLLAAMVGHATRDAPAELREPLALFATGMLNSLRREMLREPALRPSR